MSRSEPRVIRRSNLHSQTLIHNTTRDERGITYLVFDTRQLESYYMAQTQIQYRLTIQIKSI